MKEKFARNILVSLGSSIGIMSIILMLSFGNGVKTYFNNTMNSYVNPSVIEVNMPSQDDETIDLDVTTIQKPDVNKAISEKLGEDIIGQKINLRILLGQKIFSRDFIVFVACLLKV